MSWWARWKGLRAAGVLGMNARNTGAILDHNPRPRYPFVDSKWKMHELCRAIGVPTPELFAVLVATPRCAACRTCWRNTPTSW
jgi:hypothetical protein